MKKSRSPGVIRYPRVAIIKSAAIEEIKAVSFEDSSTAATVVIKMAWVM